MAHPAEAMRVNPAVVAEVGRLAEAQRARLVRLCAELVAARSPQPEGDTRAAAGAIAAFLHEEGLAPELRAAVPEKPNVVCTIGDGPLHVVLNGHLDTLPCGDEAQWSVPAYQLTRAAGRLSGLGIGNMKAGTAALAVAFAILARRIDPACGRITLTAVADEVVFGPHGTAWLLDQDRALHGDAVINGEGPGDLGVALAEKGLLWIEVTVRAPPGQGMLATRGAGAVARLAAILTEIDAWNDEQVSPPPEIAEVACAAGPHRLRLSANIGRIEAGTLISQVATEARAEIDLRLPPGLTLAELEARIDRCVSATPGATWRRLKGWDPNWTAASSDVVHAVTRAALAVRGTAVPVVRLPASDASRWRALGTPSVCFGPQPLLASGIDDFVFEQDVVDCVAIYVLAVLQLLRRGAAMQ